MRGENDEGSGDDTESETPGEAFSGEPPGRWPDTSEELPLGKEMETVSRKDGVRLCRR